MLEALASSLEAGVTAHAGLATYAGALPAGSDAAKAARLACTRLDGGAALHEALADAGLADGALVPLLRSAEQSGDTPLALREAARDLERARGLTVGLAAGLAYPAFLLLFALFVLPLPTLVTQGLAAYLGTVLPPLLAAVGLAAGLAWALRTGRLTVARLLRPTRHLPGFAGYHREVAAARICRLLGRTLAAGLPVDAALLAAEDALAFSDERLALAGARRRVAAGSGLAEALGHAEALPPETLAAVATAEAAGCLEEALSSRAAVHEQAAVTRARLLAGLLATAIGVLVMFGLAASILSRFVAALPGGDLLPSELR